MRIDYNHYEIEWDINNKYKSKIKHNVECNEVKEVLENTSLFIFDDVKHSIIEKRSFCLGITKSNRLLTIIFTMRKGKIRPISARPMNKKERGTYENAKKIQENTTF